MIESAEIALSQYRAETLQYGPGMGLPALREWIASHVREDGANTSVDEVLIVNGAKHGRDDSLP